MNPLNTTDGTSMQQRAAPNSDTGAADTTHDAAPSMRDISIIDNMTSFLEANGAADLDQQTLRHIAEALMSRISNTSPGTLQDVTMDNTYGTGYRSPCFSQQGSSSPAVQGRSVRDFEEQMSALRKENFNLKLRLYFLEESIPGYQSQAESQESTMKQLIDNKIEMEMLRKEIQEKQEILKEAAQAITQMEQLQKDTEAKAQATIDELTLKLKTAECNLEMSHSQTGDLFGQNTDTTVDVLENYNAIQKVTELQAANRQTELKLRDFQSQINQLDDILKKRDETINSYEGRLQELSYTNAELLEQLQLKHKQLCNSECENIRDELQQHKSQLADKMCELQDAEESLRNRTQIHEQACRTIQKLMVNIQHLQEEIKQLKSANSSKPSNNLSSANEKEQSSNISPSGNVDQTGLCRSTSDNEAFLDVSKSHKRKLEAIIEEKDVIINNLKADVKKKTANLQNLVNKELWEKNREIERLNKLLNQTASPATSKTNDSGNELQQSFSDAEYSRALERNKLLQRKLDILIQRLGMERNNEEAVLQLRKEAQEARTEAESAEKWRRECADVCGILSNRLEELAGFLNSLLKHKDVLGVLAIDRRRAMRKAIDRSLDLSKSLNMTLSISGVSMNEHSIAHLSNLSDILGDLEDIENKTFNSHEDLLSKHSIETLKAENKALKKELYKRRYAEQNRNRRSLPLPLDNQSESEAWSEPDRKVSLARIGLEDPSTSTTKELSKPKPAAHTDSESDTQSGAERGAPNKPRSQERITQLEQMVLQRDDRILEIQCQLVDTDNRLKKENLRIIEMSNELEHLRQRNEELHHDLITIGMQDVSSTLDESAYIRQLNEKTQALEKSQEERDRLLVETHLADMQIASLKAEMDDIRQQHELALETATKEQQQKLNALRDELESLMQQRLSAQERTYKEALARDWIARSIYEELERQNIEAERTMAELNENEKELKQTLIENELSTRALRKQLDESTLQASKAVLERTKALNEKLQMEKKVQELTQQLSAQEFERITLLQQIEQDKLVKQSAGKQQAGSDVSHSGYTSEEVVLQADGSQHAAVVSAQRINNSSPDLGIESDAGRISSAEYTSTQRSMLKTVELSVNAKENVMIHEEMNDQLEDKPKMSDAQQQTVHDCAKVDQENAELRRKLIRTKRAFEDTYEKLRIANQKKAQIEKDIKNQILKTHNVLKNVRTNMENEL